VSISGQVGSGRVQFCGFVWVTHSLLMIQNVMVNVIVKCTYSKLLVLLMFKIRCTLYLHRKYKFHEVQNACVASLFSVQDGYYS